MPQSPPDLFLSYSSSDRELVREVCRLLEARGVETFLDRKDLVGGLPWPEKLEDGLSRAGAVAVLLGRSGLGGWQRKEMYFALDRQVAEQKEGRDFPVIPVLLPGTDAKTGFLFLNTWVDLRDDPAAPEGIDELVRAARGEEREQAPEAVAICPYRGLRPFEEEDAPFFCGREAFSERLRDVVLAQPFVTVVGPSGCGKSSVVRAGLLPLLYRQRPPADTWEAATFRPRRRPFYELASALLRLADPELPFDVLDARAARLGDRLLAGEAHLEDLVDRYLDESGGSGRLLLVVDQLEELFTLSAEEQRAPLVEALLRAAGDSLAVVATLRADFYSQALGVHGNLSEALERGGQINLGPMSPGELRRAVEAPARRVGFSFQEGLVQRILDDVASEPGRLPLLQFALTELFQQARDREMTHAAYDSFGGVEGAISRRAEHEISRLDAAQQAAAQRLFVTHLVRVAPPEEGGEDTRRPARLADLDAAGRHVVEELSGENALMLVTSRDETSGEEMVEVAHEALIRQWQRLRDWVDEDRELLLWRRRLEVRRREWEAAGEDPSVLLTGPPLAEAERWLGERGDDLPPRQRDFIAASIDQRDQKVRAVRRRRAALFSATAGAAVVFLLLAVLALWGWREARAGERRAWASSVMVYATDVSETDPLTAALLVGELAEHPTLDMGPDAVYQAYAISRMAIPRTVLRVASFAFSPGGERLLTISGNEVRVRRVDGTGTPTVLARQGGRLTSAAFSPSGERIVTASTDGTVQVWQTDGAGEPTVLVGHEDMVRDVEFSSSGVHIVSASDDGTARVWRADGSGEPAILEGHGRVVSSGGFGPDRFRKRVTDAAFSPGGERIVTASDDGTVRVWQADGSGEAVVLDHAGVVDAAFSPDGERILTVGLRLRVWQADGSGEPIVLGDGSVDKAVFSPDGNRILAILGPPGDRSVQVWETDGSGEPVAFPAPGGSVVDASFGPSGRWIVTGSVDGTARLWDTTARVYGNVSTAEPIVFRGHGGPIRRAVFSPDGERVATRSDDGTIRVWEAGGPGNPRLLAGHERVVHSAVFGPRGNHVATASDDGTARVWDAEGSGAPLILQGHGGPIHSATFGPDGDHIVTASGDGTARVWRIGGPGRPVVLKGHEGPVLSAAYNPDGDRIVTTSTDGTARVWRTDGSGEPVVLEWSEVPLAIPVTSAAFSPAGDRILTVFMEGPACLWHPERSDEPIVLAGHDGLIAKAAFSPSGDRVVTASYDETARVWQVDDPGEPIILQGHDDSVLSAAFSPDGRRIVTASYDGTARVWQADGSGEPTVLEGHDEDVVGAVFNPAGDRVLTYSWDDTARVWQVDGPGEPIVLQGHEGSLTSAEFGPAGDYVVTASEDGTARVWRVGWRALVEFLRSATTACLIPAQRERYLGETPVEAATRHQECERRHGRLGS